MGVHHCARFSNQTVLMKELSKELSSISVPQLTEELIMILTPILAYSVLLMQTLLGVECKLKTEIALSTDKAEYIALSSAICEVIPFMNMLEEMSQVVELYTPKPEIHCKGFEDNESCIAIAKGYQLSPRTKHIALKYHHFRKHVTEGKFVILPISTKEQTADIITNSLCDE
eukprot:250787-Ditylum_brightwellii.AAC.1